MPSTEFPTKTERNTNSVTISPKPLKGETDIINRPIFLTHFPVEIKAFYMQKDKDEPLVAESVDCLIPGVGEIVGGSMRMYDYDELMAAFERENIDPAAYYWCTDHKYPIFPSNKLSFIILTSHFRYGSSPHGGHGLA